jgi:hypothetical protein
MAAFLNVTPADSRRFDDPERWRDMTEEDAWRNRRVRL